MSSGNSTNILSAIANKRRWQTQILWKNYEQLRHAKLQETFPDIGKIKMDREYFTKERVSLMSHVKMHIDENTFSAKEYAYMVRRMCDDIDAMIRSTSKKK